MTTRFIVVRHGQTQWNVESRIQGHRDSPLTAAGEAQAEAVAARLAAERFDVLISSDLGRARQTAERIARRCGHRVVTDTRLRE
ncbi:MAG: histidine phosphatase family protein, partial [Usitatibacter sp.]